MECTRKREELAIFIRKHTVTIYWPYLKFKGDFMCHFMTGFGYRPKVNWEWQYAVYCKILGFGLGWAYNHCANPNYVEEKE